MTDRTRTLPTTVHTDLPETSVVRREPSRRSIYPATYLTPSGWTADEYRGGNCAALVTTVTIADLDWELVILPDGDLSLPWTVDAADILTWHVLANRWDEDADGSVVTVDPTTRTEGGLVLPAPAEGDTFDNHAVVRWLEATVAAGLTAHV